MRDKSTWKQERDSLLFFPALLHFSFPSPLPKTPTRQAMSELGLITGKNSRGVKDCPGEGLPLYEAGSPIRSCV